MRRPWSLQTRLVLFVLVLVAALLGGLGASLSVLVSRVRDEVVDDELARRIERIGRNLEVGHGGEISLGE